MKEDKTAIIIVAIVIAFFLFSGFGMMGFGNYGMMGMMYGYGGYWWATNIFLGILVVLAITWLLQNGKKR